MPKCVLCKKDVDSLEHEIEHLIEEVVLMMGIGQRHQISKLLRSSHSP